MENTPHKSITVLAQVDVWAFIPKKQKLGREKKKRRMILQNPEEAPPFHVCLVTNPAEQNTNNLVTQSQKL